MKNGKKTESKSGKPMIAYPIPTNVAKLNIHFCYVYGYGYVNGSGNFGMAGFKFFDQAGYSLLTFGQVIYPHKEIVLSADERTVGVVGREDPRYPN